MNDTKPRSAPPVKIWRVTCLDGSKQYFRCGSRAEQVAMKLGTQAIDVMPIMVHRSKDGIIAALNDAGRRK